MKHPFSDLPPGFVDRVGDDAASHLAVNELFRSTTANHGFRPVIVSPLGYTKSFETFGNAASGRMFDFTDHGGRNVALTADPLVAILRAASGTDLLASNRPVRLAGSVPVFRYRNLKYRNWSLLTATVCNEKNEVAGDAMMVHLWGDLGRGLNMPVTMHFGDYGMLDIIAGQSGLTPVQARKALYDARQGERFAENSPEARFEEGVNDLRRVIGSGSEPLISLARVEEYFPYLSSRVAHAKTIFGEAAKLDVAVRLNARFSHASEYHSGLAFEVEDGNGQNIGDGGGFHATVNELGLGVDTCWSTAGALELLAQHVTLQPSDKVTLFKKDAPDEFFMNVAAGLRNRGYQVDEQWEPAKFRKEFARLEGSDRHWFAIVGEREAQEGQITLQNTSDRDRSIPLSLEALAGPGLETQFDTPTGIEPDFRLPS